MKIISNNLIDILKNIFLYGFVAVLSKSFQFLSIIFLEYELTQNEFAIYGLKYALQTGIVVFTVFGINEGIVSQYFKVSNKCRLLKDSLKIVTIAQICIVFTAIVSFYFFSYSAFLYPFINGVILGNFLMKSSVNKLNEKHLEARIFLYLPQVIFHVVIVTCYFISFDHDPFLISTIALTFLFLFSHFFKQKIAYGKINVHGLRVLIKESFSFYLMSILGWISGYGFSWLIKYLYEDKDVAEYIYLYTFSGIILLFTNSVFNVWNPYFINSKIEIPSKTQNLVYELVALGISIISIFTSICLYLFKGNFSDQLLNIAILFSSFVFYVPFWRARLYFQKIEKGWSLMRITFISTIISFVLLLLSQNILDSISVYLFFVVNSIILCILSLKEFEQKIEYKSQFLLGTLSIFLIYLVQDYILITLTGVLILTYVSLKKAVELKNLW